MALAVPRMGSIKNKIVSSDLEDERKKCGFDQKELSHYIWGNETEYLRMKDLINDMESDPVLIGSEKWYDMSREEMQENGLKRVRRIYDLYRQKYFLNFKLNYNPWWAISF